MRDTSSIGQIGEVAVMQRLIQSGWRVLIPYGNVAPYDLVAEKQGSFVRLQVRTTRCSEGYVSVNCRMKNNRQHVQPDEFDYLVVYELNGNAAYVISRTEITGRAVLHIRLLPAKSGQVRGTRPAQDYRERWDKLNHGA